MTLVTGTVQDLGYDGMEGTLWARPARFRSDGQVVLAPERKPYKITGGVVSAELAPGPAVLELQVGSHARDTFEVVIPEADISLADLLDTVFPWEPAQVSLFVAEREAAQQAKADAEQAATLAGTAKTGAELAAQQTGQDRTAVAADKQVVVGHVQALAAPNDAAVLGLISEGANTQTKAALNATYESQAKVRARSIYVGDYGPLGNSDDSATIDAAYADGTGREIVFPANAELYVNATTATGLSHATINGNGATLKLNPLGVRNSALTIRGATEDLSVYRLRILGNGNVADAMAGISGPNGSGNIRKNVRIIDCTVEETTLGIGFSADTAGSINGLLYQGNHIRNVHGVNPGYGYGLHWSANDMSTPTNVRCIGNIIDGAQRHSIYAAMAYGVTILGNQIINHRNQVTASADLRYALAVARSADVVISGNTVTKSAGGAIGIGGVRPLTNSRGYVVTGNTFTDPQGAASLAYIGQMDPAVDGIPIGLTLSNNVFRAGNTPAMVVLWNGKSIKISDNQFERTGSFGSTALAVSGNGNTGRDYLDHVAVEGNHFNLGADGPAIRISPGVDSSTARIRFRGNTKEHAANFFVMSAPWTNPHVDVQDQDVSGMVWSGVSGAAARLSGPAGTAAPVAGAGGTLPATPAGYLTVEVNGAQRKIAYY